MRRSKTLSAMALLAGLVSPAFAAQVEVSHAWFRALPAGLPAGGYFRLHNSGASEAVLTGVQSPACGMLMLHESSESGGMGRMKMVESVRVPARGMVAFKPGGYHLMCMKPAAAMKPGAEVGVTFSFADGTKTIARFAVKNAKGE